ncbi:MAG TPA: HAD-IC family P-type ATPase [Gaiellaceae bacterium]|nr:HAD-IC family P-type ATPase [Gaiellaceae bacterium]
MATLERARPLSAGSGASWHAADSGAVLTELGTSPEGLSAAEAASRLERHGPNVLPRAGADGPLRLLFRQVHNPLIWVLVAAGALAIALGKPIDGAVVLGVVVVNALIGFVQEFRAGKAIEALIEMVPDEATVLRGGARVSVDATMLVPGDVVLLASGDKVPADLRLLAVRGLMVEEAALTGESVPVAKSADTVAEESALADRTSMAYAGTLVTAGTAEAVVSATAAATELGRISSLLEGASQLETPLTRAMKRVATWLTIAISSVAALLFAIGLARGYPLVDAVLAAITLAVGAIPEGLPAIITIALAIGVQRMAHRRAVIRRLPAVETLGSTTVICTDKTGTLTRNEMTVKALWTPAGGHFGLTGVGYAPEGALECEGLALDESPQDATALLRAAVLCSDATVTSAEGGWRVAGDPTEGALVVAARKAGLDPEAERFRLPRLDAVPFESEHRFMATLHEGELLLKGAPEVVLARCRDIDVGTVAAEVDDLAEHGMRVLAVARAAHVGATIEADHLDGGFELLGLIGMIDPPRPEALEAVGVCHAAGITVKMITGDHPATAEAIARELGILNQRGRALTGVELGVMDDDELAAAAAHTNVFARVAPEHKLRLVRALQAQNHVVAMTGDGVNDAPALKQADIGVAMGITGTAVSKESADIVLADDNFASIAAAVEEGRRVYDNLIKALAFVLPTNVGFALVILVSVLFFPIENGVPLLPMEPVQLLWINLVATVALALPLAFEAKEPDLMRRPPRRPESPILSRFVLARTVLVAALMTAGALGLFLWEYYIEIDRGVAPATALAEAQTMAVTTVILFQIFYLLNCRSLRDSVFAIGLWTNPAVYIGIGTLLLLQLGFVYLPFMQELFGTAAIAAEAWLAALAVALIVLPVITLEKRLRQRRHVQQRN